MNVSPPDVPHALKRHTLLPLYEVSAVCENVNAFALSDHIWAETEGRAVDSPSVTPILK